MRLLNLIKNDKENKQIVISKMLKGYSREDFYEGIAIFRYKYSFEIPFIIIKICKKNKIDVIHSHNLRPAFWGGIANAFINKPTILEMHSVYEVSGLMKNILRKVVIRRAKLIIVISDESKRILMNEGVEGERIQVLYNGVEINRFIDPPKSFSEKELNDFFSRNKEKVIAGYIGSLRAFQGIDGVIQIVNNSRNANVTFLIIGGEPREAEYLKKKVKNSDVLVHEFISQEEVPLVYANLDILLMPRPIDKQTNSAVPLKPIEALSAGCRVLATASGGMLELKRITCIDSLEICDISEMINIINDARIHKTRKKTNIDKLTQFDLGRQREKLALLYTIVSERRS